MTRTKIGLLTALIVMLLGSAGGVGWYFYDKYQHSQRLLQDPAAAAVEETRMLLEKVSKHMIIDTSETPTIAKVTDVNQLTGNPFFAGALEGDVVMIFQDSGKVVLFRPTADRIVNIGPFTPQPEVAGTQSAQVQDTVQVQEATLTILNSTSTTGLASVAERQIVAVSDAYQVQEKANAEVDDYEKTLVVVLNSEASDMGNKLAEAVGGEVTTVLPNGENRPDTDLLLILGTDYKP